MLVPSFSEAQLTNQKYLRKKYKCTKTDVKLQLACLFLLFIHLNDH